MARQFIIRISFARMVNMNTPFTSQFIRKSICYLLIAIVLELCLIPTHMHLHHDVDHTSASHSHSMDVHLFTDQFNQDHHNNATQIDPDSAVSINKLNDFTPIVFFLFTLVFILFVPRKNTQPHTDFQPYSLKYFYNLTPPLRAPPFS